MRRGDGLDYAGLAEGLAVHFPALKEKLDAEKKWWGKEAPGQHVLFGDIVLPIVFDLIQSGRNSPSLKIFFDLAERMAVDPDMRIRSIVETTIAPELCGDEAILQRSRTMLGPELRRICDRLIS